MNILEQRESDRTNTQNSQQVIRRANKFQVIEQFLVSNYRDSLQITLIKKIYRDFKQT